MTILTQNKHSWGLFHPSHLSSSTKADTRANKPSPQAASAPAPAPPKPAPSPVQVCVCMRPKERQVLKMKSSLLLVIIIIKGIAEESKCRYCESNSTGNKVQDQIFVSLLIQPPAPHLFLSPFPLPSSPSQEYCISSLLWIEISVSSLSSASLF